MGRMSNPMSSKLLASVALVYACSGTCGIAPASADSPEPRVTQVTSSRVRVEWPAIRNASAVRVIVGPEPARTPDGPLPGGKRVATLSGGANEAEIEDLAAGAHVFLRVEADTPSGVKAKNLHVRMRGGPRAELDGPVREIGLVAPNVLRVVLSGDGNPRVWASSRWTVKRANGRAIRVRSVHRHSVPVSQPDFEIGFGADENLREVVTDHRIFVVLADAVGEREVLEIEGPGGVEITFPFSDRYSETSVIQLNQVGYNPRAQRRWAYVSQWMGDGGGLPLDRFPREAQLVRDDGAPAAAREVVVASLPISERASMDAAAGAPVKQIDLSSAPAAEGVVYRIRVPGVGVSYPTQVSELAALKTFYVVTRGLFHNRWGGDLSSRYTEWTRPVDHSHVFTAERTDLLSFFPRETPKRGRRALRGGYHDAGDFDQRPMHTVVPQLLMRAFELAPERFADGQLHIPESGNRIPDLLDEALWGVRAWEQLQERDGGVRGGVESTRHPWGIYPAHEDRLDYFTYSRDANVSARAAGLFAQASRLVSPYDAGRARELRGRAERAWRYAKQHDARSEYAIYALSELYRLTQSAEHKAELERRWNSLGRYGVFSNFAQVHNRTRDYAQGGQVMPDYILGYLRSNDPAQPLVELSHRWLTNMANETARRILDSPDAHRNARPANRPPDWGDGTVMGRYLDPIVARMSLGAMDDTQRQRYFDALSVAADYVLGANPLGMVFITGLGSRSPQEPLHLDSLVYVKRGRGPMPGIPVYGPVNELPRAEYYSHGKDRFHPRFDQHPLMLRYADLRSFVTNNEFTVWECQAPHAQHFAVLLGEGMRPPQSWRPGQPEHASPLPGRAATSELAAGTPRARRSAAGVAP